MAEISEAKRAANRENAKKSTGPRTVEGKERSRANAFKHGMAGAGVVVAEEMGEEGERRVEEWMRSMKVDAEGPEAWLVRRAAMDATRLEAVETCENARLETRIRRDDLYARADGLREAEAESAGMQLIAGNGDPIAQLVQLRATSAGCEWLIDRWSELQRRHRVQGMLTYRDYLEIRRLIGTNPNADVMSAELARLSVDYLLAQKSDPTVNEYVAEILTDACWDLATLIGPDEAPDDPETIERANARLSHYLTSRIAELDLRRASLFEAENLDDDLAAKRLLADTSTEGKLLHRYATELLRRVHQSLDHLAKLRSASPPAEQKPAKPARNEATAAASSPSSSYPVRTPLSATGLDDPSTLRLLTSQSSPGTDAPSPGKPSRDEPTASRPAIVPVDARL